MCGRYASTRSSADLATLFDAEDLTEGRLRVSYNLAPTSSVAVVRRSKRVDGPAVDVARWGLVPSWAKDPAMGSRMFNARSETAAEKPAYRAAYKRRRCLVPADGWYEWRKLEGGGKQPYYMTAADGAALAFAGLWERWGEAENSLLTCTVLTRPALGALERVHDRMPVVLPRSVRGAWLDADPELDPLHVDVDEVLASMEVRPVGKAVGNVRNDGPELIASEATSEPEGSDGDRLF